MTTEGNATPLPFTPESLAALESRAIDPAAARDLGIISVLEPVHLPKELRYRRSGEGVVSNWDGPGMVIQWTGLDGSSVPQYRPDNPVQTDGGTKRRVLKYRFPKGCGTPFNWLRRPVSEAGPVLVVEGALKGPAAALYAPGGLAVVAVPGCRVGKDVDLSWARGRQVLVAFDADRKSNPDVWDGAFWFRAALITAGASEVRFLDPAGGGKDGVDDLLGRLEPEQRRDALREWVEAATDDLGPKPVAVGGKILPNPKFASDVAAVLAAEYVDEMGNPTLLNRDGVWLSWAGPHWEELTETQVASELYRRTEESFYVKYDKDGRPVLDDQGRPKLAPWNPTRSTVSELRMALQARLDQSRLSGVDVVDNVWLKGHSPDRVMSFGNGLLNLRTRRMISHTAAYFNLSSVPYDYEPNAGPPVEWLKFLRTVWKDDEESISLLQEWFGYMLSGRTDLQKILLFLGPTGSGKGTIMRILSTMLGTQNYAGTSMGTLATNFGRQTLIGKTAVTIGDARLQRDHVIPVMEFLLGVSGEDPLQIDRKNRKPWNGTLSSRVTIISNRIPEFPDESGAMARRYLTITTHESFEGREDRGIEDRCRRELASILRWAMAGLDRLTERGYFTNPAASQATMDTNRRQAAPVSAFLDDWCETGTGADELKADVYEAYKAWAATEGIDHVMKLAQFAAALFETGRNIRAQRARRGGKQVQLFVGVKLRSTVKPGTGWVAPEETEETAPVEAVDGPLPAVQPVPAPGVHAVPDGSLETAPSAAPVEELRAVVADPFAGDLDLGYE